MPSGSVLIGRQRLRQRVLSAFEAASAGSGQAVLISGPAGMGKTTLVRAVVDDLDGQAAVGWGTCWPGESAPGYWPWTQAIEDLAELFGADAMAQAAGTSGDLLAALVPALGTARKPGGVDQRAELFSSLGRWLRTLSEQQPIVLVLDDLQWVDDSSLDLLEYLVASPLRSRILVIGAYRPEDVPEAQRSRWQQMHSKVTDLPLPGLDVDEVAELAVLEAGDHMRSMAAELHVRTGGHPLFVRELARLPDLGRTGALPEAVTDAVTLRLGDLELATRQALEVAAVAGNDVLVDVVATVLGLDVVDVLDLFDPAIDRSFLRRTSAGLAFTHDLIREVLAEGVGTRDRIRTHAQIGAALIQRIGRGAVATDVEIARHLADGLPVSDVSQALRWATAASRSEHRRGAFAEAARILARVRQLSLDRGVAISADELHALLLDEAECHARSGTPQRSRELLSRALATASGAADIADLALALQRLGSRFATRRDGVIGELERALTAVAGIDLPREARVTAALARELQHSVAAERDRAGLLSQRALDLGHECGDDATLIECLLARHDATWHPGSGAYRAELAAEIAAVAQRCGDEDRLADGLLLEVNGQLEAGDPEFRVTLHRWFELLEARDEPRDRYMVATRRAALALIDGDLDHAQELMDAAAELGSGVQEPDTLNVLMSQRVAHAHASGDPVALRQLAQDAVAHWTGAPVHAHAVAAGAFAAAGDLEAAANELVLVEAHGGWRHETSYLRAAYLPYLAAAAAALEDRDLCRDVLVEVEALVDACGMNGAVVAFAGPFAATAAILAEALGARDRAAEYRARAEEIGARLGAASWCQSPSADQTGPPRLSRQGRVWSLRWASEEVTVPHSKGMGDLAVLLQRPHVRVSAIDLASPVAGLRQEAIPVVDRKALESYRRRLGDLDAEIDERRAAHDVGHVERLERERDLLLAEVRSVTGLSGRIRPSAGAQQERARKAVSARIRDAIRRLSEVAPKAAAHLDRSVSTGLQCCYEPAETRSWSISMDG